MLINGSTLSNLNVAFNSSFNTGFTGAPAVYKRICMIASSSGPEEAYGWLADLPNIREWLGDRLVHTLSAEGYSIKNRKFEMTVRVKRTDIEDDRIGIYKPMFEDMGQRAATHPDRLLAELINGAWTTNCWDGQYFFDTDHPVGEDGNIQSVANTDGGTGPAWYLLDLSQALKPFIFQKRIDYTMQRLDSDGNENVFMRDEYLYGVRARANVGFGMWQTAWGSRQTLNPANFGNARANMGGFKDNAGNPLGLLGTHLLVPPMLEGPARKLIKNQLSDNGVSNEWMGAVELIVSPWLS